MSILFSYEDVSESAGVVTRKLIVSTNADVLTSYYAAFQLWLSFDASLVTIESQAVSVTDPQALFAINPSSPAQSSDVGIIKLAGLSLQGVAPGEDFFEITYSHSSDLDPEFEVTNALFDEVLVSQAPIITKQSDPNSGVITEPVNSEVAYTVAQIFGTSNGYTLYTFTNGTAGFSSEVTEVEGVVSSQSTKILQQAFGVPIDLTSAVDSGLTSVEFEVIDTSAIVSIDLADGSSSRLQFALATGVLTGSESSSAEPELPESPEITETVLQYDGVNTGTGVTDPQGVEVVATDVLSLLPDAEAAITVYRQRLGDAVAIEAMNRDGSVVGTFIGEIDARTVRQVSNGSMELTVDLPAAAGIDVMGMATPTDVNGASRYLFDVIDAALPATTGANAPWNAALKQAVSKAALEQDAQEFKLDVLTPYRQISGGDEMSIGYAGDGDAMAAVNLSQVDDLVSVSGYDSIVAVGPGELLISSSSDVSVYGDTWNQSVVGGRGSDYLSGGGGVDVLTGGAGVDTFELGFPGLTTVRDLSSEDVIAFDLFGVTSVEQLISRIQTIGPSNTGLRVQFDTFAVDLVGYTDIGQVQSAIVF